MFVLKEVRNNAINYRRTAIRPFKINLGRRCSPPNVSGSSSISKMKQTDQGKQKMRNKTVKYGCLSPFSDMSKNYLLNGSFDFSTY